jgi:hypothetical protein
VSPVNQVSRPAGMLLVARGWRTRQPLRGSLDLRLVRFALRSAPKSHRWAEREDKLTFSESESVDSQSRKANPEGQNHSPVTWEVNQACGSPSATRSYGLCYFILQCPGPATDVSPGSVTRQYLAPPLLPPLARRPVPTGPGPLVGFQFSVVCGFAEMSCNISLLRHSPWPVCTPVASLPSSGTVCVRMSVYLSTPGDQPVDLALSPQASCLPLHNLCSHSPHGGPDSLCCPGSYIDGPQVHLSTHISFWNRKMVAQPGSRTGFGGGPCPGSRT